MAGIGEARHAGVGHESHPCPARDRAHELGDARALVPRMDGEQLRVATIRDGSLQKDPSDARVLARDDVGARQRPGGTGRQVLEVADGRRDDR